MTDLLRLLRTFAWLALFGALYQELRKPPEERTWHGKVAGAIPYDFRVPTFEKLRRAYWDPSSDRIFSDHVFGVGWAVNFPVLARKLNAAATQYLAASSRRARGGADEAPASRRPRVGEDDAAS